jgi:exosortase
MTSANVASPSEFSAASIEREPPRNNPLRSGATIQMVAIGALLLVGQLPLLIRFFQDLWSRPQYQFFPVAIVAAGYVGWERVRGTRPGDLKRGSMPVVAGLLVLAWIVLCGGLLYLRLMAPVSTLLMLVAVAWWAGGGKLTRTLLPTFILLLVIIPPPARFDEVMGNQLRFWAVHASGRLLDFVWVPHVISGTVLEIPGRRLLVEEACSGINSLMSVIAFSLLYGFWQRRTPIVIALLTVAAAGFVLCANIVRITTGAVLIHYWKIDILGGTAHESLGVLLFAISLGLVISFDRFLLMVVPPRAENDIPEPDPVEQRKERALVTPPPPGGARRLLWWTAAIVFAALGVAMQVRISHAWVASHLSDDASFALPAQLAGWEHLEGEATLNGRPETVGRKSQFWLYRSGELTAGIAMDYPFVGFHDATTCYAIAGWKIQNSGAVRLASAPRDGYYAVTMSKPPMLQGQMLFAQIDEQGHTPPEIQANPNGLSSLQFYLLLSRQKAQAPPTYQIQTLTLGAAPLSQQQQARVRDLFLAARHALAGQLVANIEGNR